MTKHTRNSSNLAAFAWHLSKMMNELITSCHQCCANDGENNNTNNNNTNTNTWNATAKITMVGKARVVCGALNLFRIICHEVIVASFEQFDDRQEPKQQQQHNHSYEFLQEAFTYQLRQKEAHHHHHHHHNTDYIDTSSQLISTLLSFISMMGHGHRNNNHARTMNLIQSVPELYDATVLSLMLLTVLFSTQLYQPLQTSFELRDEVYNHHYNSSTNGGNGTVIYNHFFLDIVMKQADFNRSVSSSPWTSQSILSSFLNWMIERPTPPPRSIAAHVKDMVETIAIDVKGEKVGPDGMFENHAIVMSRAPNKSDSDGGDDEGNRKSNGGSSYATSLTRRRTAPNVILDATNKVLHLSSSLLLLPFRLMTLALKALGHPENFLLLRSGKASGEGFDDIKLAQLQAAYGARGGSDASMASPTNDVLWLSDSPIADLGSSIFLILSNSYRASSHTENGDLDSNFEDRFMKNAFRSDLASLDDNRWDSWNNSYSPSNRNGYNNIGEGHDTFESIDVSSNGNLENEIEYRSLLQQNQLPSQKKLLLTTNFEYLFQSFGGTIHNELGALTLYTLLQSSPIFAASLAVRSDLDMLVLPLLRTLYFSSTANQHIAGRTSATSAATTPSGDKVSNSSTTVAVSQNPFRSQSQLYVIMILLLIFSQDTSFGPDSFRRSNIPTIPWYKERSLKNVSLGSMIILALLRCITFNLNRLHDPFLLSNCCAILLNLSPNIANLHPYASMRLVSVLISSMKRYTVLVMKNAGNAADESDVSSPLGMYAEVSV